MTRNKLLFSNKKIWLLLWILKIQTSFIHATSDSSASKPDQKSDRSGRAWHYPSSAPQSLQQHQQNQPGLYIQTSTNQPGDSASGNDANGGRNFEEQDKTALPAASEQDYLTSRHYGYPNIQRFDPNFPYYDRSPYPRFPSPHNSRFGPGYRKDKYGHGYGYSCKHGDDCDEVRAANQIPPNPPPRIPLPHHAPFPPHQNIPPPYNSHFMDPSAFSNMPPSFPGHVPFSPYSASGLYPPSPARFNDLHMPLPHQMPPRFYHGRYLHEQDGTKNEEKTSATKNE